MNAQLKQLVIQLEQLLAMQQLLLNRIEERCHTHDDRIRELETTLSALLHLIPVHDNTLPLTPPRTAN